MHCFEQHRTRNLKILCQGKVMIFDASSLLSFIALVKRLEVFQSQVLSSAVFHDLASKKIPKK
jgi:hypothetical protein